MPTLRFQLRGEYVALCALLKLTGLAESGGAAKYWVASGAVTVDGHTETRKTAKIRAGQTVCYADQVIVVDAPPAAQTPDMSASPADC